MNMFFENLKLLSFTWIKLKIKNPKAEKIYGKILINKRMRESAIKIKKQLEL